MNTEFLGHLALAVQHAVRAAAALVPPGPRRHLEVIGRELAALLTELAAGPVKNQRPTGASDGAGRIRRIDIEE
jgi:hypothetical protein